LGKIWYRKNIAENQLIIYNEEPTPISYRLTAPRFDWQKWLNVSGDGSVQGLTIGEVVNDKYVKITGTDVQIKEQDNLTNAFVQKVKQALSDFGLFIENGVASVKEVIAGTVKTDNIEIQGKIQLQDQTTRDIYCTWIDRGEWVKVKGLCQDK
jgi:uncharacterized protein (UPF0264 family)